MRSFSSAVTACLLGLPLVAHCDTPSHGVPVVSSEGISPREKAVDESDPGAASPTTLHSTSTPLESISSTAISTRSSLSQSYTTTTSVDSASVSASTSTLSSSSTSPTTSSTSLSLVSSSISMAAESSSTMSSVSSTLTYNQNSNRHKTLVIVLSSVLGFFGLAVIASTALLCSHYKRGKWPFGHHRGASPIGDDEIASWRRHTQEKRFPPPTPDTIKPCESHPPIPLVYSPGWTWTASPTSIRTISVTMPDSPAFLAKAPNSRVGLTDETVPGAYPYIPPIKRQPSRLSKQPPGHSREKSRKSSTSAKSSWSLDGRLRGSIDTNVQDRISTWYDPYPEAKEGRIQPRTTTWYDPEDETVSQSLENIENGSSTPGTSIFNGLEVTGGLSPRPKSRVSSRRWGDGEKEEIGRAIG